MDSLDRDRLFVGMTRPQMLLGVTYGYAIGNAVLTTELFLVFGSIWIAAAALVIHGIGVAVCAHDPHLFDIWLVKSRHCARNRSWEYWRCNSYRA